MDTTKKDIEKAVKTVDLINKFLKDLRKILNIDDYKNQDGKLFCLTVLSPYAMIASHEIISLANLFDHKNIDALKEMFLFLLDESLTHKEDKKKNNNLKVIVNNKELKGE